MRRGIFSFVVLALLVAGCRGERPATANLNVANKVALRPVHLFYEAPSELLVAETRSIPLPESPAGALPAVVRELLKGPTAPNVYRVWPEDAAVRGAYMVGDVAFVDLGGPTLSAGWGTGSHNEVMAIYSMIQTIASNFPNVKYVRFLVNGAPSETLGGHVSITKSLPPKPALVDPRFRSI